MAGLFEELKRRNVIRVAMAYVAVSWLLIQVVGELFPVYGLSDAAIRVVVAILAVGFIPVLIISWVFELTPEGLVRDEDVDRSRSIASLTGRKLDFMIIAVLVVALGFFAVFRPASFTEGQRSIAVLAFVNMSSDPEQEYFSDGLAEDILNLLTRIPDLKVIARTSSFSFKAKNEDVRDIGKALGVKTVLQGSVRKSGDRLRIVAQLVNVLNGAHIWSETYDREITDIFAVQDDVAAASIDALQMHIGAMPTRGRPTESPEAYAVFLKARTFANSHKGRESVKMLRRVIEVDPNFAEAHELLAASYWSAGGGTINNTEAFTLMGEAAAKALAINPDLPFAQALYDISPASIRIELA